VLRPRSRATGTLHAARVRRVASPTSPAKARRHPISGEAIQQYTLVVAFPVQTGTFSAAVFPRTHRFVAALLLVGACCLTQTSTSRALTIINAVAPADGATLPLDQPTTFIIQSADCGTLWWLQASYSPDRNAEHSLVDRLAFPVFDRSTWTLDASGDCETTWDPRLISYSALPSPGPTLYWQAWRNDGATVSPVQSLVVSAGTRVPPPSPDEVGITVDEGAVYTNDPNVKITVAAPEFATRLLISNDGGFAGADALSIPESDRATYDWKLVSSGPERLPKTVYVRFSRPASEPTPICAAGPALAAPTGATVDVCGINPTTTFSDDIILDQTDPEIVSASLSEGSGTSSTASASAGWPMENRPNASRRRHGGRSGEILKIHARDNLSGVHLMRIARKKPTRSRWRRFSSRIRLRGKPKRVFLRVRDGAGNASNWRRVALRHAGKSHRHTQRRPTR
jgi:hypothetical protein